MELPCLYVECRARALRTAATHFAKMWRNSIENAAGFRGSCSPWEGGLETAARNPSPSSCVSGQLRHIPSIDIPSGAYAMPSPMLAQPNAPAVTSAGKSGRGSAGVYELQLRRKLLQQQLGVVEDECKRVGKVVAKKHLAKLCRQENAGGRGHAPAAAAVLLW